MRILHVCNHFYPCVGGVERYVLDLSRELIKSGHTSDVCCLNTCAYKKDILPEKETVNGITVYRIQYLNLRYYKIAPSVMKFVRDYDIIHIHGIGFFLDFLNITRWLHKKPIVVSTHGGIFHTSKIAGTKKLYFNTIARISLRGAKAIIATGKGDYETFSKISKNVALIEPGIDYEKFAGIPHRPEKNTFLFVGRIAKNKRLDNLIKAFAILKKTVPDAKIYAAGEDWDNSLEGLRALSKSLGVEKSVVFTGKVTDRELTKYYSKAQFFVSASEYEGFGISVIEAMAAGCVPILNDIEAFRAIVDDKKNGFIVSFGNPEGAAKEIAQIKISHPKLRQLETAAKNAAKKYDWAGTAKKIASKYGGR